MNFGSSVQIDEVRSKDEGKADITAEELDKLNRAIALLSKALTEP